MNVPVLTSKQCIFSIKNVDGLPINIQAVAKNAWAKPIKQTKNKNFKTSSFRLNRTGNKLKMKKKFK